MLRNSGNRDAVLQWPTHNALTRVRVEAVRRLRGAGIELTPLLIAGDVLITWAAMSWWRASSINRRRRTSYSSTPTNRVPSATGSCWLLRCPALSLESVRLFRSYAFLEHWQSHLFHAVRSFCSTIIGSQGWACDRSPLGRLAISASQIGIAARRRRQVISPFG